MRTEYPAQQYNAESLRERGNARARALPGRLGVDPSALKEARILEIGCGYGEHCAALEDIYAAKVIGIDPWDRVTSGPFHSRDFYRPIDITDDSVLELGSFDFISSYDTLEHVEQPHLAIQNIIRLLKPHGRAFLKYNLYRGSSASHLIHILKFPWVHLLHTPEEIRNMMIERSGIDRGPAWVNKLTYAHYLLYFKQFGAKIVREWYVIDKMSDDFYDLHREKLKAYPRDELDRNFMCVTLKKNNRLSSVKNRTR